MSERNSDKFSLHMCVQTRNGEEMRPVESLSRLVNYRGMPEYVQMPVLREGEEIYRTLDGGCHIVEGQLPYPDVETPDLRFEDYYDVPLRS